MNLKIFKCLCFIAGGYTGSFVTSIETFTSSSGSFTQNSETMPIGMFGHCSVKWRDDVFFTIGGTTGSSPGRKVYKWQVGVSWTALASLKEPRSSLGCALTQDRQVIGAM